MHEPLLRVADVAKQLGISKDQVYTIKGQIHYVKLGGAIRFRQQDVDRYVQEHLFGEEKTQVPKPRFKHLGV